MDLLKSPWFWSAVIWFVAAVLFLVWIFRPSPSERAIEEHPAETAKRLDEAENFLDIPDSLIFTEPENIPAEVLPAAPPDETPTKEKQESSTPEEKSLPEAPMPEEKPTVPESKPAVPEKPEEKQPAETKPASPPKKKLDANLLISKIKKVSIVFQSSDRDSSSTLNLTVKRQVMDALEQLGIKSDKNAQAVMVVDVRISKSSNAFTVEIYSALGCNIEGHKKPIKVWEQKKQVVSILSQRVREPQMLHVLRIGTKEFFNQLVDDVRKARIHAKFQ